MTLRTRTAVLAATAALFLAVFPALCARPAAAQSTNRGTIGTMGAGMASWYGAETCPGTYGTARCRTATGAVYDADGMTLAVRPDLRWMLGKRIGLRNPSTGRTVTALANDVCPGCGRNGRVFDLSRGTMRALGGGGVVAVEYRVGGFSPALPPPSSTPVVWLQVGEQVYADDGCLVQKRSWSAPDGRAVDTFDVLPPCA